MDITNCLTIRTLAETFDCGNLTWLKSEVDQFIRYNIEDLRKPASGKGTSRCIRTQGYKLLLCGQFFVTDCN